MLPSAEAGLAVTAPLLRSHYNVTDAGVASGPSWQSVTALIGQFFSAADLTEYENLFAPNAKGLSVAKIIGPDAGMPGMEANLDVQVMVGVGQGTTTWFWSIPNNSSDPFIDWIKEIHDTPTVPQVHSTSYGGPESDETPAYLLAMDTEFAGLGARGLSLLFASGDSGVGCSKSKFAPDWPASSAYVTAVGGTKFSGLFESGHEVVNGLSGGGFSNVYPQPAYQQAAVASYLASGVALPSPSKGYNTSNRGYPDISALSAGFVIVEAKIPTPGVAGTSCASPTAAAIFALLNAQRLAAGKPSLGFLNPWLYSVAAKTPGALFDVTQGSNAACGTNGFPAAPGWDPSSGLGTPNYAVLKTII